MKFNVFRNGQPTEVAPRDLTTAELCHYLSHLEIDTSECWLPEAAKAESWAAINEAIRRIKNNAGKTLPEIVKDMRQNYEANQGCPTSAAPLLAYANQLDALMRRLFTVKNANSYSDANKAFRAWKEAHEAPEDAKLPTWVKDFVNWLMAEEVPR